MKTASRAQKRRRGGRGKEKNARRGPLGDPWGVRERPRGRREGPKGDVFFFGGPLGTVLGRLRETMVDALRHAQGRLC